MELKVAISFSPHWLFVTVVLITTFLILAYSLSAELSQAQRNNRFTYI